MEKIFLIIYKNKERIKSPMSMLLTVEETILAAVPSRKIVLSSKSKYLKKSSQTV